MFAAIAIVPPLWTYPRRLPQDADQEIPREWGTACHHGTLIPWICAHDPMGAMEMPGKQKNEGEGNRTAARAYNAATEKFAKSGRVGKQAQCAQEAVDGPQKAELERAERVGKSKARGEDPALSRKASSR